MTIARRRLPMAVLALIGLIPLHLFLRNVSGAPVAADGRIPG